MADPSRGNTPGTQQPDRVSTKPRRIAELARAHPQRVFIALNHYLDYDWLYQAYVRTRKDGAPGIDGVTAAAYASALRENLQGLLERLPSGRYQAPAVRRAYVPKGDGTPRPLGIPTFEDKVAQRLAKYGLTLHPTKTHLVDFRVGPDRERSSGEPPAHTFDFLGFTPLWKRSWRGAWAVIRKTAQKRPARSLRRVYDYCRRQRHDSLREQHQYLCRLLRGHYAYYGILGNARGIAHFAYQVRRLWHKWLKRRNGLRRLTWAKFNGMLQRLALPAPRIVHTFGWTP